MTGASDKALKAGAEALDLGGRLRATRAILAAAHDPALGLDRSVSLRDVFKWLSELPAEIYTADDLCELLERHEF